MQLKVDFKKKETILLVLLILVSFLVIFYCQYFLLTDRYAIHGDVRQTVYSYLQYQDPELFQGDVIANHYRKWTPWGVSFVYFVVGLFFDPIQFTKVLPFFLCGFSVFLMYMLGKSLKNHIVGFLSGFMFIFVAWSREIFEFFGPGDATDFSIPFCLLFLYFFFKRDFLKAAISVVLLSVFYPPLLLICLLTYLCSLIFDFLKFHKTEKKKLLFFFGVVTISIAVLYIKYAQGPIKLIALKEMKEMAEFYPGGRNPIFFHSAIKRWTNYESGLAIDYPVKWLFSVSFVMLLLLRKKILKIPLLFWCFIISSIVLYMITYIFMYKLYAPSRYMRYSLPIFLILFTSLNINKFYETIKPKGKQLIFLLSFVLFIPFCFMPKLQRYSFTAPSPDLYRFLKTLPKSILVAGHPVLMDYVPAFAKRKVFINEETSLPYFLDFYPIIKERTYQFFKAYYSDNLADVYEFCKNYNITHFVVYKSHFSRGYLMKGQFYFNPFNEYINNLIKGKTIFALMDILDSKKIFEDNEVFVVRVEDIVTQE